MKLLLPLLFIALFSTQSFSQKKSEIIQKGIEVKRFYEQDIEDGDKEAYLVKEEFYNFRGELIEHKDYKDKGSEIKSWFKYKYDDEGNLIEELELDEKGEQKERIEYKYQRGLRIEKNQYDEKDRLSKRREYNYEFRK